MCGITGIVHSDRTVPVAEGTLRAMCDAIQHRGPDDQGMHLDGAVGLGMRRLSIIDVAGGHQPIYNEDRTCVIVQNGEIYNHLDLRRELERRGHRYTTHSDTETILHAYEEYGVQFVTHLRGMFAIAIWDAPRRRLVLARDRMGKKPVYYAHTDTGIVFGSEIKAILAHPGVPRRLDEQALAEYVAWGYVPDPRSIYAGIAKLPPAHTLVFENGRVTVERYWDVSFAEITRGQPESFYVDRALEILDEAVRIRLMSEVPLGAFLSGGTDSSVVVALMARHSLSPVKTFSIGFEEKAYNELEYAREVAAHFNTEHHEEVVLPDAENDVPALVRQFDEPFADSSMIPTYYVCRSARRHVTVALSGDGGDELFAGYLRYVDPANVRAVDRIPAPVRNALFAPVAHMLPEGTKGIDRLRDMLGTADEQYVRRMTQGLPNMHRTVFTDSMAKRVDTDPSHVAAPFLAVAAAGANTLSRRQYLDIHTYLAGDILSKVDRTSMKVSLECRAPLLDQELAAFAATIPPELRMRGMTTKYILKKVAERLMPAEMVHRPKMGFAVPVAHWLRDQWAGTSHDLILSPRVLERGIFRETFLRRIVDEHGAGKRDNSYMMWSLMMLEMWFRECFD
ncbi:MAG TPA: asparagine synthase (glutamine-hydrolyzing) [Candidatus Krumholzibacteria bacterium]|nr:asparagine synthase (glutamine-hydrolyzing) [Candidatus Krumholzibacteria bacterium]